MTDAEDPEPAELQERLLIGPCGRRLHLVRRRGRPGQPTVVLLHQVPSSSWMWHRLMDDPALEGLELLAPDLPGYGASDPSAEPPRLERIADHVVEVLDSVTQAQEVTLVGHHTGAMLALCILDRHPRFARCVVAVGLPYQRDWRSRLARMTASQPLDPDSDPDQLRRTWEYTRASFEPESDPGWALRAFADRLAAGPTWFHGYVALHLYDAPAAATRLRERCADVRLVYVRDDAVSRHAAHAEADLGSAATWIPGRAWVALEDPGPLAQLIATTAQEGSG